MCDNQLASGELELISMLVEQQRWNRSLENYTFRLRLLEQQNRKRLDVARQEQETGASRRSSLSSSRVNVNNRGASPASIKPSPTYFSARSSPWPTKCIQQSPQSFKLSPLYHTAYSSPSFLFESSHITEERRVLLLPSAYVQAVTNRGLFLPPDLELNWSRRENGGQHVEFAKREELSLKIISKIGMGLTATVDKVRCRHIILARKTMTCGRRLSIQDALLEVEHLQKLRHAHIIQLVGSYLLGKEICGLVVSSR